MNKRIAIIDSGIGGTSLLAELIGKQVGVEIFYQADSKFVPYGEKTQSFMIERMKLMIHSLPKVDSIVIACNTLTAEAIEVLRSEFDLPIFGIEPFIKYVSTRGEDDKIGLILTPATSKSKRLKQLVADYDPEGKITIIPLENLALLIENYQSLDSELIKEELAPLKKYGFNKLILGCTHYPLIKNFIETYLELETIDPNPAVVNHIIESLDLRPGASEVSYRFNLEDQWSKDIKLPLINLGDL